MCVQFSVDKFNLTSAGAVRIILSVFISKRPLFSLFLWIIGCIQCPHKWMFTSFKNILPKRCIIAFVKTSAFNGGLKESPFKFEHFKLNYLSAYLESIPIQTERCICDITNNQYSKAYNSLFEDCNVYQQDTGNKISREAYPKGYTLFAVDLTPDLSASASHLSLPKTGSLRMEVRFD